MSVSVSWEDLPEEYDLHVGKCFKKNASPNSVFKNLLIKADNYKALDFLLNGENLREKINLIYIDPPYNTGNDFIYNDTFSHDAWLSFMSRRLMLARELLQSSGCIFIAIDQSELYVLKLLCDQIFGEENFVNDFMWLHGKGKKDKWSRTLQQHTLCFAKNKKNLKAFEEIEYSDWAKKNVDNDARGNWFSGSISFSEERSNPNHRNYYSITSPSGKTWTRQWQITKEEMDALIADNRIYWGNAPEFDCVPRKKVFNETPTKVIPRNIIENVESTRAAQNHLDNLLGKKNLFDNPKPVDLISHLIEITQMPKDALILDFFAGSGTTFEAVCALNKKDGGNRKCILVQKDENNIFEICKERCEKVSEIYGNEIQIIDAGSGPA